MIAVSKIDSVYYFLQILTSALCSMVVVITTVRTRWEGSFAAVTKVTPSAPTTEPAMVRPRCYNYSSIYMYIRYKYNNSPLYIFISAVDPVAMCVDSNCAQSCVRLLGVETCGCFPGYELASNEIDCSSTLSRCESRDIHVLSIDIRWFIVDQFGAGPCALCAN